MNHRPYTSLTILAALLVAAGIAGAAEIDFDFDGSTPVGSWQEREQVTEDGGKTSVSIMKLKYLGDEERNGETYSWLETEAKSFKVKKKGRKQQGDTVYMKALIKKSLLEGDVVNSIGNFNDMAIDIIMQSGDQQPMRIKNAGEMMGGVARATGLQISYELTADGSEEVSVPAGTFSCDRYRGKGSATMDLMIKKMRVDSNAIQWISKDVPFGVVKIVSEDTVNGKPQHSETTLLSFGRSGATSGITGEPEDMPEMPSLGGLFGG